MFDSPEIGDNDSVIEPALKKKKLNKPCDSKQIHSSLGYSSLRAPPLIEYKSIEGYCESRLGKSLLPSFDKPNNSPSTSGLNNLQSISSPIVFKSPKPPPLKKPLLSHGPKPFDFFSVEELSLVKCLRHWTNTKVCAVGLTCYDRATQQCYLESVMEQRRWQLLLDTSLLREIPNLQKLIQLFGTLEVIDSIPRLKVNFHRNLGSVDLPLFIESYKLMQKYIPEDVKLPENDHVVDLDSSEVVDTVSRNKLNDTLDGYNFSLIM